MPVEAIGKAPTKTILVNPQDREQQVYDMSLILAMNFFKLTDRTVDERRRAKEQIEVIAPAARSAGQWCDLAELAFDLGDWGVAREALQALAKTDTQIKARASLVAGSCEINSEPGNGTRVAVKVEIPLEVA